MPLDGRELGVLHDKANVLALPPIIIMIILMTNDLGLFQLGGSHWAPPLVYYMIAYIVLDMIFLVLFPHSVPSTTRFISLLVHHTATLTLLVWVLKPMFLYGHAHLVSQAAIIEINTLILTLYKLSHDKILMKLHYFTWFFFRLGMCSRLFYFQVTHLPIYVHLISGKNRLVSVPCVRVAF